MTRDLKEVRVQAMWKYNNIPRKGIRRPEMRAYLMCLRERKEARVAGGT